MFSLRLPKVPRRSVRWSSTSKLPLSNIIKVNAFTTAPHYYLPWQKKASRQSSGSGFILETEYGKSLLTNAHVVSDTSYVTVRRSLSSVSYEAQVEAFSHESDLAILSVKDKNFWTETKSDCPGLRLGRLPHLQDHVNVVGFPTGGEGVSVTRGVVSRIEPIQYAHGGIHLLGVQIDASINPGNSGGPALLESEGENNDREVVGVAFQSLAGADNIGYIIPPPVINHFLTQYHLHKNYTGFPQLGIHWQPLENASMRENLKLKKDTTGILVVRVSKVSPAHEVLHTGDVILSIDGTVIANNGTVEFFGGERVFLNYLLVHKFVGDSCNMDILRNGEKLSVSFKLKSSTELSLVPVKSNGLPSYVIYGGLVFTVLTIPYLREFEGEEQDNWYEVAPRHLVHKALTCLREYPDQEVVILSHVLADDLNYGYTNFYNKELDKFNGVEIRNIKQLFQLLQGCQEEFAKFEFKDKGIVILNTKLVQKRTKSIMRQYAVPSLHSEDLNN
eukprot:TRINITY_DN1190_c0_g1_i1.p1 TRINITY_DN1190_c0_g1~~TRINITY_DN1190_c0_g1_i1.p1  ORF type:complete len:503 (+),score=91.25 TRINITY_DN1190_c0_g1_i1:520-2028(+)